MLMIKWKTMVFIIVTSCVVCLIYFQHRTTSLTNPSSSTRNILYLSKIYLQEGVKQTMKVIDSNRNYKVKNKAIRLHLSNEHKNEANLPNLSDEPKNKAILPHTSDKTKKEANLPHTSDEPKKKENLLHVSDELEHKVIKSSTTEDAYKVIHSHLSDDTDNKPIYSHPGDGTVHLFLNDELNEHKFKTIAWENVPDWITTKQEFSSCEINNCVMRSNATDADVVIINMIDYHKLKPFPRKRNQIWIAFSLESPYHIFSKSMSLPPWDHQVNWTMTYHQKSTFPVMYGMVKKRKQTHPKNKQLILSTKTGLVAWVVSNCKFDDSKRQNYTRLLQKHLRMPIDIYGDCGSRTAPKDIFSKIERSYKFYLAFENSLCEDYITEKFFLRQDLNLVLIVRGGGNYSQHYPQDSYIDTRDFDSPRHLAEYLGYLNRNDTAYMEYIYNKQTYFVNQDRSNVLQQAFCDICKRVHRPIHHHSYVSVGKWFSVDNMCHSPTDLVD